MLEANIFIQMSSGLNTTASTRGLQLQNNLSQHLMKWGSWSPDGTTLILHYTPIMSVFGHFFASATCSSLCSLSSSLHCWWVFCAGALVQPNFLVGLRLGQAWFTLLHPSSQGDDARWFVLELEFSTTGIFSSLNNQIQHFPVLR